MTVSRGPRTSRAALRVEYLEDRTTPSTLTDQVATGAILGDRVNVVLNAGASASVLTSAPFVTEARWLGFDTYSVHLTPGTDLDAAISTLAARPNVRAAEPDWVVRAALRPNDASYNQTYGTVTTQAQLAWNVTTGDPNFVVAVIDSGIDYTHPDLVKNVWTNAGETPGNGIDDDSNGYIDDYYGWDFVNNDNDPMDDDGHGTHVSGTIGAVGNNGIGVAGINWNVKVMGLKFLDASGSGPISAAIAAINYSVSMGVKVSNNSWGGGGPSVALAQAILQAQSAGQIFVAAAGNGGFDGVGDDNDATPEWPTNYSLAYDNVVSVAAIDNADALGGFSNYGATSVTLAAPGVQVLSTIPGGQYALFDGTSMASPHVAGAIALYWGANPTLTYQEVIAKLKSSVDLVPGLNGKVATGGRLNVAAMFDYTPTIPPVVVPAPVGTDVVRVLAPGGATDRALTPHPGFLGGIAIAAGDVTGDGVADAVTAATLGGHVKVFDGSTNEELRSFYAFEGYQGPINLAIGDITGDGIGDIIVAANLNGHIKVFDGLTGELTFSQFVYAGYNGSIAVAAADLDGDGRNDLVTGADGGQGVHIKEFNARSMTLRDSFMATSSGYWNNFSVSALDLDGDEIAELLVSQGPRVRVLNSATRAVKADFLAFDPLSQAPVMVEAGRFKGDRTPELVVIAEPQSRSHVKVFDGPNFVLTDSFYAGTR